MIQILPEEVFIYEKALQDLGMFEDVDKPAQRLTLLMAPKKPIDYDNLNGSRMDSTTNKKHQTSTTNIKIKPVEMERNSNK